MIENNKFDKVLTVLLIIIVVALIVAAGFWGFDIFQKYYINKNANEAVDEFDKKIDELNNTDLEVVNDTENSNEENTTSNSSKKKSSTSTKKATMKYKGYDVIGKIEIPKTRVSYPVLAQASVSSMKVSVGVVYGPGLNEIGNTVLMGHNYRNGALFSNNKKLSNGDSIFITDMTGRRLEYKIYNTYITSSTDFDYAVRNTAGKREISLASCTDDSKSRLIIWAKEK